MHQRRLAICDNSRPTAERLRSDTTGRRGFRGQRLKWLALLALLAGVLSAGVQAEDDVAALRVMSFNIRYNNPQDGPNAWPHRREWVAQIVRDSDADVAGFQEVLHSQMQNLQELLPGYAWHGVGRDDGKQQGEYVPVFYRRERFELVDKSVFWLSETPDVAGSKSWDAAITRVTTWVKLKDRDTGVEFFVFNTHFDHRGVEARTQSAQLLRRRMQDIAHDAPVVLLGDFNSRTSSKAYQILTGDIAAEGVALADAWSSSRTKVNGPDSTWNGFRSIIPGRRIDFIFIGGKLGVRSHTILDEQREGRFPSDHLPVLAELSFEQ